MNDSHVQINCTAEDCGLRYIDGTLASSLSVDCAGSGCVASHIICPVGNGSYCTVDCSNSSADCSYLKIENAAGGEISSLNVHCQSCLYITISLDPDSISDINILCDGEDSCYGLSVDVSSKIENRFSLDCDGSTSCGWGSIYVFGDNEESAVVAVDCKYNGGTVLYHGES